MRLKKSQKESLLKWISEGLQSDEINDRAAQFDEPFQVSKQHVDYYRARRAVDIKAIQHAGELNALTAGLALKAERVRKLQMLAALMEKDLFGGFLWTDQVKALGSGEFMQVVDYEEFNTAEVQQYRGVLDDIAKEVGDRKVKQEVSGPNGAPLNVTSTDLDRAAQEITAWRKQMSEQLNGLNVQPTPPTPAMPTESSMTRKG